jgi:hypothetical protein
MMSVMTSDDVRDEFMSVMTSDDVRDESMSVMTSDDVRDEFMSVMTTDDVRDEFMSMMNTLHSLRALRTCPDGIMRIASDVERPASSVPGLDEA